MTSLLEQRYRRALRILPAGYRKDWQEDMVATFLDRAYASSPDDPEGVEIASPRLAELASVAALAVRIRLGGLGAAPRYLAWGDAIRRVALAGLLFNAVAALLTTLLQFWIARRLPGLRIPTDLRPLVPRQVLLGLTSLLWALSYASIVYGRRRAAAVFGMAAFVPIAVASGANLIAGDGVDIVTRIGVLLCFALPLLCLAAFHQDAPPINPRPWLIALPVGVALTFPLVLFGQTSLYRAPLFDLPSIACVAVIIAAIVHSVLTRDSPADMLALALLGLAAFVYRAATLAGYLAFTAGLPGYSILIALSTVEAITVLIVATVLSVKAVRRLRTLPANPQQ